MPHSLKDKVVLITGGSGFIGRELMVALRRQEPSVRLRAFDIRSPGEPGIETFVGSVLDRTTLRNAMTGVDYVIHLAAWLGVEASDLQPLKCLDINIEGTTRVLETAAMSGVQKVVFASSSEVYGDALELPIRETTPLNPKSVYAVTKLAGEEYARGYSAQYGFANTIVRFFNVYGPRQDLRFVVPRFVECALAGQPPRIFGDGSQTRAFCHVSDAARGVVQALVSDAADGGTFNIGNPDGLTSIRDLWQRVTRLRGISLPPDFIGFSAETRTESREITRRCPDISRAQSVLGYAPVMDLDDGLKSVIDHRQKSPAGLAAE
jgi:UDP-glucose 4-epimerase